MSRWVTRSIEYIRVRSIPGISAAEDNNMTSASLESIARAMVQPGKGILAADESTGTIQRRFATIESSS